MLGLAALFSFGCLLLPPVAIAQDAERRGCTATLDEARYGKPKSQANKFAVTASWRNVGKTVQVRAEATANGVGTNAETQEWRPVGFGWIALDYQRNLYYRISYSEDGYQLDASIPELGSESCTWKRAGK